MTVHRKDLFCRTLYCRSQSPQVAVLLFFFFFFLALVQSPYTEKEVILVVSLPSNYLSNRIIYLLYI